MGLLKPIIIPGNFRTDMVSDEEILLFLEQKVRGKYPQGSVKRTFKRAGVQPFQVYPTSTNIGPLVLAPVTCSVMVRRKNNGELMVWVDVGNLSFLAIADLILMFLCLRKRLALKEEVAGWLTPFLQSKHNP